MEDKITESKTDSKFGTEILQLVTFFIGNEEFAVDILNIQGINRMIDVTKVPNSPDFLEGIINLRGKVIPLVNLRKRLGLPTISSDRSTRFIVVELGSKVIGFIVDSVNEVLRISRDIIEPPPQMVSGVKSEYITSVGKLQDRLLILLDLEKILSKEEFQTIENTINK
jgi:purine-binding chemotaxis protein CheW